MSVNDRADESATAFSSRDWIGMKSSSVRAILLEFALTTYLAVTTILGSIGQVSEWLKEPVSKTGVPVTVPWVRIPPCPLKGQASGTRHQASLIAKLMPGACWLMPRCFVGQVAEWFKAHAWKACGGATHSRVRIPPCP
jgi:hypothetical protein